MSGRGARLEEVREALAKLRRENEKSEYFSILFVRAGVLYCMFRSFVLKLARLRSDIVLQSQRPSVDDDWMRWNHTLPLGCDLVEREPVLATNERDLFSVLLWPDFLRGLSLRHTN